MTRLKRALGIFSLTFFGVGMIVGAGVYSVIGAAAGRAEDALWMSFVLGACVAFLTGLSYAELATAYPEAGAEYVYLREAFPGQRVAAFIAGFLIILAGSATIATVSMAFGGYLKLFLDVPVWLSAAVLIGLCCAINIIGIRQSTLANIVLTLIEVGGLLLVVITGAGQPDFGKALSAAPHMGVLGASALIFFVYLGFEDIANLAEEAIKPGRDVPRAIVISLAVTTVLYILVGLSVVALMSPAELAQSESPLASALAQASPAFARALGWIALVATANTALIGSIVTSRMIFSIARSGDLPSAFAGLTKRQSPWLAALVTLALGLLHLPLARLDLVASVSSFAALLAFLGVNAALISLRRSKPRLKRGFRIPVDIAGLPLSAMLGIAAILALLTQFEWRVYLIGGCGLLAGFALFALTGGKGKSRGAKAKA